MSSLMFDKDSFKKCFSDMLSQEMGKTSIGISNESGSKNHQQNSDLETPKVSLEEEEGKALTELIKSF